MARCTSPMLHVLVTFALVNVGCSEEEQPGCPAGSRVVHVESSAKLEAAADTAKPGDCLALPNGDYAYLDLPAGVSVVGDGRDHVTLVGVTVHGGEGAVLSTFTVRGLGIDIAEAATGVVISQVHVDESGGNAIEVRAGGAVAIENVQIDDVAQAGVRAVDATSVSLADVTIERAGGPALTARCGDGCDCPAPSSVSLTRVAARQAGRIGLGFHGVTTALDEVDVSGVTGGPGEPAPAAVVAGGCARLQGGGLRIADDEPADPMFGLLLDGAAAELGLDPSRGIEIQGATGSVWVQRSTADVPVALANAKLVGNHGVAIGIGAGAAGILLEDIAVAATSMSSLDVYDPEGVSMADIGDAVQWQPGASARIERLSLAGSARLGILIDGPVGAASLLGQVTLGADAGRIVQQSIDGAGAPETTPETPPIEASSEATYAVAVPPLTPSFD